MRIFSLILMGCILASTSCSEKKSDGGSENPDVASTASKDDPLTTDAEDPADPEADTTVGSLAIASSANEVIQSTLNALQSVSEGESFGTLSPTTTEAGTLAIATGEQLQLNLTLSGSDDDEGQDDDGDGPSAANPNCNGNGTPFAKNGEELKTGDLGYMLKTFYCLLHDKESPDVVLGAIGIMRGFICLAEKQEGFAYSPEGTTVEISYTDILGQQDARDCFPPEVIANDGEERKVFDYRATASGYLLKEGPWTNRIHLREVEKGDDRPDEPEETFFFANASQAAFKRGTISASLDFKKGILRFENLEIEQGRHTRFLVKGTIEKSGAFSIVNALEAVQTSVHTTLTARGSSTEGYTYNHFTYNCMDCADDSIPHEENTSTPWSKYTGGTWSYLGSECLGRSDCAKENAPIFSTEADAEFLATQVPEQKEKIETWSSSHGARSPQN